MQTKIGCRRESDRWADGRSVRAAALLACVSASLLALMPAVAWPADAAPAGAAPVAAPAGVKLPVLASGAKVLAFGDSLTAGIGGSGHSYPQRLAQLIGHEVIDAGVPGDTSAQGLKRLGAALQEVQPGLMILCLGINDYLRAVPSATLQAQMRAMIDQALAAGVPVLVLAVPVPRTRQVDPWFAELAQAGRVRVDQHAMADVLSNAALKADVVHPNREGYQRVADAVARSLRDSGALGR